MPSREQVSFHNEEQLRLAREQAEREAAARNQMASLQTDEQRRQAQYTAERDQLLAGLQSQQMNQQAGIQANRDQMGTFYQGQLNQQGALLQDFRDTRQAGFTAERDQRQAANQWNENIQRKDLAAELSQIQLTQGEAARARQLKEAIAGVNQNPELSPEEKRMLITELTSKLNPLENRSRQANILQTQIQTQGMFQQNEQQATLFNQRQQHLARGMEGNIQYITDPETGIRQGFYMNANNEPTPLDFAQAREAHQMRMATGAVGVAAGVQNIQQSGQLFPGQLANQGLVNQGLGQNIQQSAARFPLEQTFASIRNMTAQQSFNQMLQTDPIQLQMLAESARQQPLLFATQQEGRTLANNLARIDLQFRPQMVQQELAGLTARTGVTQQQLVQMPEQFAAWRTLNSIQTQLARGEIDSQQLNQAYRGLQLTNLADEVRRAPLMRDLDARLLEANVNTADATAARNWLTNELLIMEVESMFGGGGEADAPPAGGPGPNQVVPGVPNRWGPAIQSIPPRPPGGGGAGPRVNVTGSGRVTVTNGVSHSLTPQDLTRITASANAHVRTLTAGRGGNGQPPRMTEAEITAAYRAEEARLIRLAESQRAATGLTPTQAISLSERLRNAPPAVQRALGITLNNATDTSGGGNWESNQPPQTDIFSQPPTMGLPPPTFIPQP